MTDHATRTHAKYSGSSIKRARKCHGFARLARALNRTWGDSESSEEGTTVHELIEIAMRDGLSVAMQDVRWTEDRARSISWLVDYVVELTKVYPDLEVHTEQRVYFPQNVVAREEAAGVADLALISRGAAIGWLIDYKNGVVAVDDPVENDQLWFYATARFWEEPVGEIRLVIVQPNGIGCAPVREHTISPVELVPFQAEVERLILVCEGHDVRLTPGDWCADCAVGAECSARERDAIKALTGHDGTYQTLLAEELPAPESLDVERWATLRSAANRVRGWLKAVEDASYAYAIKGGVVPGFKVVEAAGHRAFLGGISATAEALADITGRPAHTFIDVSLVGITEAEKLVKETARKSANSKGLNDRFATLVDKKSSGNLSLVPLDDPRPEYSKAVSTFVGVIPPTVV